MKFILAAAAMLAASLAQADVYKCIETDPATGERRVTYTNSRQASGCERLSTDLPVSSVPGVATPRPAAPSSFPKVSADDQKARDNDRRKILESELQAEEAALESARKALAEEDAVRYGQERNYQKKLDRLAPFQQRVEQHERNVEALKKEIANLK
jgi:hypothetical protein